MDNYFVLHTTSSIKVERRLGEGVGRIGVMGEEGLLGAVDELSSGQSKKCKNYKAALKVVK